MHPFLTAVLVVLTYAAYFFGPWPLPGNDLGAMIENYRFLNRTIAACVLVAITALNAATTGSGADRLGPPIGAPYRRAFPGRAAPPWSR